MIVHPLNKTLDDPPMYKKSVILLVEIKRATKSHDIWYFYEVLDQTDQQALRAFASFPEVKTLGLIVALGDCWTYREYHREKMVASPSLSEKTDPTYHETPKDSVSPSVSVDFVSRHFGPKGFARLQDPASDAALGAVLLSLRNLWFTPECECYIPLPA